MMIVSEEDSLLQYYFNKEITDIYQIQCAAHALCHPI